MFEEKLQQIENRYEELNGFLSQPDAMKNQSLWLDSLKEQAKLQEIVTAIGQYHKLCAHLEELEEILGGQDAELIELAEEEKSEVMDALAEAEENLKIMLVPRDPDDDKNVILEIRAGTGGEEAALFGAVLLKMYNRYAEIRGWRVELTDINETEIGGCKEATMMITGTGAWSRLKYESGVHRVQRVPETESGGRIHTSAATVAVLPETEDVELEINDKDLRIDKYNSSGAGGQHVNKTESAIRITHLPTGIVVTCQDERSQIKNKDKAMRVLRARLYDKFRSEKDAQYSEQRRSQVGSGDRSERIRTYNYPQNRITDHRIGVTLYRLDSFVAGDIDELLDMLIMADKTERASQE